MSKLPVSLTVAMALTLAAGAASAESYDATKDAKPSQGYLGVGASIGVQRAIMGGMTIDGGKRLGHTPLFVRGQMTGGKSGTDGSFVQLRGGVEARGCLFGSLLCAFGGLDAGYQRDHVIDDQLFDNDPVEIDAHDAVLIPRLGLEAGTKIKLRTALELPLYKRLDKNDDNTMDSQAGTGLALTFGIAGVF
jgi:hypothetical protein